MYYFSALSFRKHLPHSFRCSFSIIFVRCFGGGACGETARVYVVPQGMELFLLQLIFLSFHSFTITNITSGTSLLVSVPWQARSLSSPTLLSSLAELIVAIQFHFLRNTHARVLLPGMEGKAMPGLQ